jgi:hypothetical protein
MKTFRVSSEQLRVLMAALEVYVEREQKLAEENGLAATADQELAEDMLDALEQGVSPLFA